MAEEKIPLLHLEAMKASQNEGQESGKAGDARVASIQKRYSRKEYWAVVGSGILTHTITNKRLAAAGYFEILAYYESMHLCD